MLSYLQFQRRAPGISVWRAVVWWGLCINLLRVSLFFCYGMRTKGRDNVPRTGPLLVVANHQSNFDPAIVGSALLDRPFLGIARESLFGSKFLSWFMRGFGVIALKRGESDVVAIRKAIIELQAGRGIMMFPEGTRTQDGTMNDFQRGFWLLMKKSKATVLPVGLDGAYNVYPMGSKPTLKGKIAVAIGKPITAELLLELGEEEGTAVVRASIQELVDSCTRRIS